MINNSDLLSHAAHAMKGMEVGDCLLYRTFKKDRSVSVERTDAGFDVTEDGFERREWRGLEQKQALKLLKKLRDAEFPRSNRLYNSLRHGR